MNLVLDLLRKAAGSFPAIFAVSIFAGLLLPDHLSPLSPYLTWMLTALFFFNSMRISVKEMVHDLHEWKMILLGVSWMLIGAALVSWFASLALWPEMAMPFLLLAVVPAGTTMPLLVEVMGGRPSLALIFTVVTSLIAPLTVPFTVRILAHEAVHVNTLGMFTDLLIIIIIPFIFAQLIHHARPKAIEKYSRSIRGLVTVMLALVIATVVAKQAVTATSSGTDWNLFAISIVAMIALFIFFGVSGWLLAWGRPAKVKLTMSMCITNTNFSLAIYLASQYFPHPIIVIPVILSVVPWTMSVIPFRAIGKRIEQGKPPLSFRTR